MKTIIVNEYEYDLILMALRCASVQCGIEHDEDSSEDMNLLADRIMNNDSTIPQYYACKPKINGRMFKD